MTDLASTDAFRTLGPTSSIPDDLVVPFYLDDRKLRVSVVRAGDRLYAFDDLCTCAEPACPLSGGLLVDATTIRCQCHGSEFDLATGAVLRGPATTPLRTHTAREVAGELQVDLAGMPRPTPWNGDAARPGRAGGLAVVVIAAVAAVVACVVLVRRATRSDIGGSRS